MSTPDPPSSAAVHNGLLVKAGLLLSLNGQSACQRRPPIALVQSCPSKIAFRLFPLFNSRLLAALFGGSTSLVCHLLKVGNGSCNHNGVFFFSLPLRRKANSIHSLEPATIRLGKASSNVQSCTARSKVWPVFEHCLPNVHTRPAIQRSCTQRPVSESRLVAFS